MQNVASIHPAYTNSDDHLADWHALVLALLGRWLSRYSHRLFDLHGNRHDVEISLAEAIALSCGAPGLGDDGEHQRAQELHVSSLRRRIHDRLAASSDGSNLVVEELRALFGLTDRELEALLVCAMPRMSVDAARMTQHMTGRDDASPMLGQLAEVCSDSPSVGLVQLGALRPDGRLRTLGLLEVDGEGVTACVTVPSSVVDYLHHHQIQLPPSVRGACTLHKAAAAIEPQRLLVDGLVSRRIERALRAPDARLIVSGPEGVGRRTAVRSWLAARGAGVLELDLAHMVATHGASALVVAAREARLRRAELLVRADGLDSLPAEVVGALRDALAGIPGRLVLTAPKVDGQLRRLLPRAEHVELPAQSPDQQRAAWQAAVADGDIAAELVRRFQLTAGAIHRVADAADGHSVPELTRAARAAATHTLDDLAEPISTGLSWDDVVLPPETESRLREVVEHARHRELVFDDWGFGDKVRYGGGLSCLFSGPPGTGKTMMATVLGRALGREVWRVDVSRLVSKWIGETEKNLARVFDEAERGQVVLLFDEADSLFAKRTAVRGSNDRNANMEVNFLLQKMESHPGVTILTTNLLRGIDEAFLRRIRFKIAFEAPDAAARATLWRRLLPPRAPLAADIDYDALGAQFDMSGGNIRNAVLRAAFEAATAGTSIDHAALYDAGLAQAREMGRLVRS